jgi:hypothetical protein
MSKDALARARVLIQQKQYNAAREILESIPNDPTARDWLTKLDDIAPRIVAKSKHITPEKPVGQGGGFINILISAVAAIILAIIVGIGGYYAGRSSGETSGKETAEQGYQVALAETAAAIPPISTQVVFTPTSTEFVLPTRIACELEMQAWWEEAEPFLINFLDVAEVASVTARLNVGELVLDMREVQRNFEGVDYEFCAADVRREVVFGMDSAVEGYNWFMGENEIGMRLSMTQANQYFHNGYQMLQNYRIFSDFRMLTTINIWGGDAPIEPTPTADPNVPTSTTRPTIPQGEGFKRTPSVEP